MPEYYRIVRELTTAGRHAHAEALRHARPAAQRLRHRPQPRARRRGRHPGHPQHPRLGRAAGRAGPRDQPRRQPRHPHRLGGRRRGHGHHLRRPHGHVGRHVRRRRRRRRQPQPARPAGPQPSSPRWPPRSCRWPSAAAGSSRPTAPAPASSATASPWPGPWPSSSRAPGTIPMDVDPAQASKYIVNPLTGRKVQFANLFTHPPADGGPHRPPPGRRVAEHEPARGAESPSRPVSPVRGRNRGG